MRDFYSNHLAITTVEDWHADSIDPLEAFSKDLTIRERVKANIASPQGSVMYSILAPSGKPLAIVFGHFPFSKVMEVSAFVDKDILRYRHFYARAMKMILEMNIEFTGVRRVQMTIRTDQAWATRWAEYLGFKQEGILQGYGEDLAPHYLFSRVEG